MIITAPLLALSAEQFNKLFYKPAVESASKTNTAYKALYERFRTKGKTGKQALMAVCNKLLKQAFRREKQHTLPTQLRLHKTLINPKIYLVFYTVHAGLNPASHTLIAA